MIAEASGTGDIAPSHDGQVICDGEVFIPPFCAAEMVTSKTKLVKECPAELEQLLKDRDCRKEYELLIGELSNDSKVRKFTGWWINEKVVAKLAIYAPAFEAKGVTITLCERGKRGATERWLWLEFVDNEKAKAAGQEDYSSQFDVRRLEEGEAFKTNYEKIKFPAGVAVERLRNYSGRKKLKQKVPEKVEALMKEKDCVSLYEELVEAIASSPGSAFGGWKSKEVQNIVDQFVIRFKVKGVGLFYCKKEEYVHTGQSGYMHIFRWLEFVDFEKVPDYVPARGQYDIKPEKEECIIL